MHLGRNTQVWDATVTAAGKTIDVDVAVSGSRIEVSFDGAGLGFPGPITMSLEVKEDSATGSGSGPRGPFTVTGARTRKPSAVDAVSEVAP